MPYIAPLHPHTEPVRDSIGGHPFLLAHMEWPVCPRSKQRMVLFFQFTTREEFGLSLAPGSQIAVFMSPAVNEIPTFTFVEDGAELTQDHWVKRESHFKTFVFGPDAKLVAHPDADAFLVPQRLDFEPDDDPSDPFLFVGGEPRWYQDAETHPGFDFVCQLSEDFGFPKQPKAPEQPDSFSTKEYCLFLGNSVYLLTRARPEDHEEVWVVVQN